MASTPIPIEPLTEEEKKEKEQNKEPSYKDPKDDPEYPKDWLHKDIEDLINKGYKYYRRKQRGQIYMVLRKGKHDRGLGKWDQNKELRLFKYYPNLGTRGGIPIPSGTPQPQITGQEFMGIPIRRVPVIPRDYVPTIDVIRYWQIMKEEGFPGDFSQFVNEIITEHFRKCHGILLPVMLEEDLVKP